MATRMCSAIIIGGDRDVIMQKRHEMFSAN